MLKIKLVQTGRKGFRSHRIVVQERREKREGNIVELLGTFSPKPNPMVRLNKERFEYWIKVGAKPTPSVSKLIEIGDKNNN